MRSWLFVCCLLSAACWRFPSLGYQNLSTVLCIALLPIPVLVQSSDPFRALMQVLLGLVGLAASVSLESNADLAPGTLAPLAVAGLLCLTNTLSPPPYPLAKFILQMGYLLSLAGVYVVRHYWSAEIGVAYLLGMVLALLASSQFRPFQAKPGAHLRGLELGSENEQQTAAFIVGFFAAAFIGPLVQLGLGLPQIWLLSVWLNFAAVAVALYVRVLLITGLRFGPAERYGDPGPRLPQVKAVPWTSYGMATPMLVMNSLVPFNPQEHPALLGLHGVLSLVAFGALILPALVRNAK